MMAMAPVVAVMIFQASGGAIALARGRGQRGPSVIGLLAVGMGLLLSALIHVSLVDWVKPLFVLLPLGFAIGAAVAFLTGGRRHDAAGAVIFLLAAVVGLGVHADRLLDRHPASEIRTTVGYKSVTHGRSNTYHLSLVGVPAGIGSITVGRAYFDATRIGDPLCLTLHPGAFAWPWYTHHDCGSAPAP